MRKDFVAMSGEETEDELEFIERYWSDIWEQEGGPVGAIKRIRRQPEYHMMKPVLEAFEPASKVLDAGCGLGDWTLLLSEQGFDVTGIDISKRTVALLQERFDQASFTVGDIRQTGFPDNYFDLYFSWGVFEHFENGQQKCIDEAWRILKPGGYLFISVPFDNWRHAFRACLASWRKLTPDSEKLRFYQWRLTRQELALELRRGGFELHKVRTIHKRQGALRMISTTFGLPYQWLFTRVLRAGLALFLPGPLIAHMQIAMARKSLNS